MNLDQLAHFIGDIHRELQLAATKAVNKSLTVRNWLIGRYLHEYELHGEDRAAYGEELFPNLASRLRKLGIPSCGKSRLYRYRNFYLLYPQIVATLSPQLHNLLSNNEIPSDIESQKRPQSGESPMVTTPSPPCGLSGSLLTEGFSYSHFELLVEIPDVLKRSFYEIECLKGGWSVRELRRQIASLYFERSGLSTDKEAMSQLANQAAETAPNTIAIRDPYVFEFLGLRPQEILPEDDLEAALLGKLEAFLLELGHGFCFEARQKRLVIGGEHFFVDLVFYHRVLKCHVLVELKVDEFRHENLGQLNTYVSYYRAQEMTAGDKRPIGILLCTGKNHALVEYALAGMENRLFVSKYQLALPKPEELQRYLDDQRRLIEEGRS